MLKGDLSSTPLAPLLLDLADDQGTGCLNITDSAGEEAQVFFKAGLIYAVSVPGSRPQLGAKLVSSGAVAPEALAEALEAQRSELQGWRLGELLVHLGYVDQPVVEAFVKEQVSEAIWDLLRWNNAEWRFRKNVRAREDVGPPMVVVALLETLRDRGYEWETISAVVHGPAAIPMLSTRDNGVAETTLDNDAWSMLCKIDGERSVSDLAGDCGYTLFEAGQIIVSLVQAGLVDIAEDLELAGNELYGARTLTSALTGELDDDIDDLVPVVPEDAMSRLARLVTEVASDHLLETDPDAAAEQAAAEPPASTDDAPAAPAAPKATRTDDNRTLQQMSNESFAASMSRVSNALSDVLGDAPTVTETPEEIQHRRAEQRRKASAKTPADPEWERRKRNREAAAAELATAHSVMDTLHADPDTVAAPEFTGEIPKVVSTETERRRAAERAAEEAARHAAEQEARAAADAFAKAAAEEAERHAAEQAVKRLAAEHAAAQAEAEAAALAEAEAAARAAEQEAELAALARAEQLAAEQAERAAIEESAWAEYWQREEAERSAAEAAAALAAAAVEEAERAAAEVAEQQAAADAARIAAEEAEQQAAAEETERLATAAAEAAAEAERQAAQDAAEQAAAEAAEAAAAEAAEAERQAAAEAERLAAAEAAERQAAEEAADAERQAAEEAAERQAAAAAADADAELAAQTANDHKTEAQAKAERAAQREADKAAADEAANHADEAARATKLLVELASGTDPDPVPQPVAEPEPAKVETPAAVAAADSAAADNNGYFANDPIPSDQDWSEAGMADTAALLRELSSLGVDDEPVRNEATPPNRAPRAHPTDKKTKKKIGIFGL